MVGIGARINGNIFILLVWSIKTFKCLSPYQMYVIWVFTPWVVLKKYGQCLGRSSQLTGNQSVLSQISIVHLWTFIKYLCVQWTSVHNSLMYFLIQIHYTLDCIAQQNWISKISVANSGWTCEKLFFQYPKVFLWCSCNKLTWKYEENMAVIE